MNTGKQDFNPLKSDPKIQAKILMHPLFGKMSASEISSVLPFFTLLILETGDIIMEEGKSTSKELLVILEGNLEVIKTRKDNIQTTFAQHKEMLFTIAYVKSGDVLGELSFVKDAPRSATIRSISQSIVLSLDPLHMDEMRDNFPRITSIMMQNLLGYVSERLRSTSDNEVQALTARLDESERNAKSNIFFSYIIGLLCIYNLAINLIAKWSATPVTTSIVSASIIFFFMAGCVLIIKRSKLPFHLFGVTLINWKKSLGESMLWTIMIMAAMLGIKWLLVLYVPAFQGQPIINFQPMAQRWMTFNFILYGIHAPIQEFIARGVLQGSLQNFFLGRRNSVARAIIVSNALFAATHVHLFNGLLALVVFIPGLFWGWLYSRHQTLIGVSLSHILIGWWGLFVLSF